MRGSDSAEDRDDFPIVPAAADLQGGGGKEAAPQAGPRPWGAWATLGWTLLCLTAMMADQLGVLIAFLAAGAGSTRNLPEVTSNSLFLSASTLASTPILLRLMARLNHAGVAKSSHRQRRGKDATE